MRHVVVTVLLAAILSACAGDEAQEPGPPPDVFHFDSGGAHHIEGFGAWRVTASRDGRFQAAHDVRGNETVYDEVVLEPPARAGLWALIDAAGIDTLGGSQRPGVPDEVELTFRLEKSTGETLEVTLWQNDVRDRFPLVSLLQELKIRIEEACGVQPIF